MSETIREMVVRLSLDSGSLTSQMKSANTAIKQAEANFKLAGAGVTNFEKTLAGAQAKVTMLTQKLSVQSTAVTKHKAALDAARDALVKNQAQQQTLAQKIEAARKAYDAEAVATGKSSEASQKLADDLKKLEAQQLDAEKQASRHAKAINDGELSLTYATIATKETEAALEQANQEVSKASTVWARFGEVTKDAQDALSRAGKALGATGRNLTVGLTVPIVAAGTAAYAAFNTVDDGMDTVIRKTGATGAALEGLEASYNKVFTGVKTTAADAGIAIGEVNTRFKVTGQELENLSTLFIQFADVNQTDLNGSIGQTQKILSQWNLTAKDASGFLGLLTSESQRTGLSVEALMGVIQQNGATLKGMGLDLSQSVQLMANFEAAGINADTAMAALKKSAGEYTKQGKTLEEGLAGTIAAILGAKDETKALAIAQKAFGAKGALEMATAIREGRLSVTGLTADMKAMDGVVQRTFQDINNDTPVLDRVKNKLIATGATFGKALLPFIEQAAAKLETLVGGFTNLDPAMQKNILTFGAAAAAVGPALSAFGKIATGASALMKAFSGPAGWITLAVGALAGLGVAIASIPTDAQKAAAALDGITIGNIGRIGGEIVDQAGITAAVNAGIAAANKEHAITVKADADLQSILDQIDLIFADDKVTRKEWKTVSTYINDLVNPDIEAARLALKTKVDEYVAELDRAVNAEGKPLTDEEKQTLAADYAAKQGEALAQLEAAKADMDRLLAVVKAAGSNATAEQIAELETAIAKVLQLRAQVQIGLDEAAQAMKADYNLTVSGGGNEQSTAGAVGYVSQTRANAIADAEAAKQTALAAAVNDTAAAQAAYEAYDAAVAAANATAQAGYEAIAAGVAESSTGAQTLLTDLVAVGDQLNQLKTTAQLTGTEFTAAFDGLFGPGGALEGLADKNLMDLYGMNILAFDASGDPQYQADANSVAQGIIDQVTLALSEKVNATGADPALNPLNKMLIAFTQSGAFQAIDPTTVQGPLEDVLKLVDLKTQGTALGDQAAEGVSIGVTSGAKTWLTKEKLDPLRENLETAVKDVLEINSPSRIMLPYGEQVSAGLAKGITDNTSAMTNAIKDLYDAATLEADRQEVLLRKHLAWLEATRPGSKPTEAETYGSRGGVVNNYDNASFVVNVNSQTDVAVLQAMLDARKRRASAGYGANS